MGSGSASVTCKKVFSVEQEHGQTAGSREGVGGEEMEALSRHGFFYTFGRKAKK